MSMSLRCLPSSFGSISFMVLKEMSFEEFQDQNGAILAILNLHLATMPSTISFSSIQSSEGDVENVKS